MSDQGSAVQKRNRTQSICTQGPPARRQSGPFNPSVLGRAAHEVIAELAAGGLRHACWENIAAAVAAHPVCQQPTVRRQAARQWLCSVVSLYFRLFVPLEGWNLVGSEVLAPGCRFDLVWRSRFQGSVIADELKSGKAPDFIGGSRLEEQLARQLRGGSEQYGEHFTGVRVLVLAAPARSFVALPNGDRMPVYAPENS